MNGALRATLVAMVVAAGCGGAASEATQKVTLLAADAPTEIVVRTTSTTTTTSSTTTTTTSGVVAETTTSVVVAETTIRTASETSVDEGDEDGPATTVEPVKETIPLVEEKVPPGIQMMDALEEFNGCLGDEGVEFIGRPNAELGGSALVNQPAYIEALTLCAARSGIVTAMQEYQSSRVGRTPEKIREENEQFIALIGCLRSMGWTVSDPMPDADGSLGPGDDFRGPDGDLDVDDIRSCISELSLLDDDDE